MRDILEFYHLYFSQNIEFDTLNSEILKNHLAINKLHVFALHLSGRNLVRKIEVFSRHNISTQWFIHGLSTFML